MTDSANSRSIARRSFLLLTATVGLVAALPRAVRSVRGRYFRRTVGAMLTPSETALVSAYADALLPRTQTPGALDVGVPDFVAFMNRENYGTAERELLAEALAHLDETAHTVGGKGFVDLASDARARVLQAIEKDPKAPAARAYSQLRRLVLHGYFTSEVVQRQVLRTVIAPGRFDGNVALTLINGGGSGGA